MHLPIYVLYYIQLFSIFALFASISLHLLHLTFLEHSKTLNEDGEIGLARLFSIWANMMCAPGAATIVGCRPITMLSEILAQVHAYLTVHPLYDPEGLALYVELHHMMDAILMGDWFE